MRTTPRCWPHDQPVNLSLPRFTATYNTQLSDALTTLGMGIAFQPGLGDLSGIYPNAYLSSVQHATLVQVDETGTVAAGTTIGSIGVTSVPQGVTVQVNRPFLYAIRDNQTGILLFVGVIVNPSGG
jgi:serpin B